MRANRPSPIRRTSTNRQLDVDGLFDQAGEVLVRIRDFRELCFEDIDWL
jgi:hypothetical protein